MSARSLTLSVLVSLCSLAIGLSLPGAVQATVTHKYLSRISEVPPKGPPPAEATVESPGSLTRTGSLTVDAGELYAAADTASGENLNKFNDATGAFIAQFPRFPSAAFPSLFDFDQGLAVGHGAGETEEYVPGDENSPGGPVGRVAVFDAAGKFQGLWDGSDTPGEHTFGCFECGGYGGIAVDGSGNLLTKGFVYVLAPAHDVVDVFEPKPGGGEKYVTQLTGPEPGVPFVGLGSGPGGGVAVDQSSGDVLVVDGHNAVDVFEPTAPGEYSLARRLTGTPSGPFTRATGVAVDGGNGDIYVIEREQGTIDQFSATGSYLGHLTGVGTPTGAFGVLGGGLAVDPTTHDVYVGDRSSRGAFVDVFGPSVVVPDVSTEPASNEKATSVTLNGTVNPDGAGAATCRFEWGTSASFGNVSPCEPEGVASGSSPVAVHVVLRGLQTDATYYYRLQASNANGTNPGEAFQDRQFSTSGPGIHEQSASIVTASSATLNAKIDPDNAATTYYFQYGTSATYSSSVPAPPGVSIGAGKGDLSVGVHLQGLAAGTVYHYRVVALSETNGEPLTVDGPDRIFATQVAGAEVTQPDGRQWELVSPPNKQGAAIIALGNEQGDDIQAAANGGGITYGATASFVANPAGNRSIEVTQVISTRNAPGDWGTADISTPHNEGAKALAVGHSAEYKLFSTDLSDGLVEPADDTPLPPLPAGAERTLYLREAGGAYKALVTSENVPPGTKFGNDGEGGGPVNFDSASPDFKHVVLTSPVKLTPSPGPANEGRALYEWSDGQLQLASVLPDGEPAGASLGSGGQIVRHAISDDGSRVVWTASTPTGTHIYMRDMARGETVTVDAAQGRSEPHSQGLSQYSTANSDDSRVFFTSSGPLTPNSTASEGEGEDLYVFEVTSGAGEPLAGKLTDLTVDENFGETGDVRGANVRGVIGASEDGSYVYFVGGGLLGEAAARGAVSEGNNLYVEHYDAGTKTWSAPEFIAALVAGDATSWKSSSSMKELTARVSPDGRYLAFMSENSLTGYENRDANSDVPDQEVFLYNAGTGRLTCASCNPTGARPVGSKGSQSYEERLWDYAQTWQGRWVAGDIPGWTTTDLSTALYQSRYLSDSGRLFFNSSDALVPADVNGKEDVYEYEPSGVGSCQGSDHGQSASVVFSESLGGCVGLISSGTSSEESAFMDASETGGDVFFLTLSRLAPQDYDTSVDLYDAHECTVSAPCAPPPPLVPPPCTTGDACKPGPTPQPTLFGAPSSETFSGAGNVVPAAAESGTATPRSTTQARKLGQALKACKKKPKRRRATCERQARKRYGAKQSQIKRNLSTATGR